MKFSSLGITLNTIPEIRVVTPTSVLDDVRFEIISGMSLGATECRNLKINCIITTYLVFLILLFFQQVTWVTSMNKHHKYS